MPRTKQRSIRRAKRRPPRRITREAPLQPDIQTRSTSTGDESAPTTASERKLSLSPYTSSEYPSSISSSDSESECAGVSRGSRILEIRGVQSALKCVCCKACGGPVSFKEELFKREGLCTHPYLFCQNCKTKTPIPFAKCGSRSLAVNRRAVLANKCVGCSYTSPETLFVLLHLPPPVSQHAYQQHMKAVAVGACAEVEESMRRAREEVRDLYDALLDQVVDLLVSCDGTWQKRGFSSLFGVVFIIAYETGKVLDYAVSSKHCTGCKKWENRDQTSPDYLAWKEKHVCSR